MKLQRLIKSGLDLFNTLRRYIEQRMDQFIALTWKKLGPAKHVEEFDGEPRFALITVNFSTTYYLKLMLLTFCEQDDLQDIYRIIIVDNDSKDGGISFLKRLDAAVDRLHLVENHFMCTHARGLRKGIEFLDKVEVSEEPDMKSNLLLVCDTDIIFRNKATLTELTTIFRSNDTAFSGELRYNLYPYPEAQASFFAMRRDCYERPDVAPFVHHGAPAYWTQRSLWRAGLHLHDFPSNHGGYILHRGRSGVVAASKHYPFSAFATVSNNEPHYMGIANGPDIWNTLEQQYSNLLREDEEDKLIKYLAIKLQVLGKNC